MKGLSSLVPATPALSGRSIAYSV
jgi:hypothetical protein